MAVEFPKTFHGVEGGDSLKLAPKLVSVGFLTLLSVIPNCPASLERVITLLPLNLRARCAHFVVLECGAQPHPTGDKGNMSVVSGVLIRIDVLSCALEDILGF